MITGKVDTASNYITRRLATTKRMQMHISIHVTFLAMTGDMINLVKVYLLSGLINKQNLITVCHTVWVYAGHHKNLDLQRKGACLILQKHALSTLLCQIWSFYITL